MNKLRLLFLFLLLPFSGLYLGCQSSQDAGAERVATQNHDPVEAARPDIPDFDATAAYDYIARQVAFGPRVPGTKAQLDCAAWLQKKLKKFCDTVYRQQTTVTAGNQEELRCINLVGVINPDAKRRILLLAHWDSRPWADEERPPSDQPIDGADDGASGVGVLLEIAHVLKTRPIGDLGVDVLLTDVEDYGKTEWGDDSYALGTQYWATHPHISGYHADAGILLDMVGARNARFPMEGYSKKYAPNILREVWAAAGKAGYSSYFVFEPGGMITDDHVPVNELLKIPTIDIINLPAGSATGFGSYWHTHRDTMDIIDTNTLKAVGQTLLQYIYSY